MDNGIEQALQPPDVQEFRGCFTNTVITAAHLCTATDSSSPCHIAAQLSVCNELLLTVQLVLQEHSPGHLHLASLEGREPNTQSGHEVDQAFLLVSCLLKNHPCIVSLHIKPWNYFRKYEEMVSSSYRPNAELKSLRLVGNLWFAGGKELLMQAVARSLPLLTGLEEFHCYIFENPYSLIERLCCLLEKSSALKKLALRHFNPTPREAMLFCSVLSKNFTLTNLSINSRLITPQGANYTLDFAASLENSPVLNSLAILCDKSFHASELKYIFDAVGRNKSIVDLSLSYCRIDTKISVAIENLLTGNCFLRRFSMGSCYWHREPGEADHSYYNQDAIGIISDRIRPWINILRKNHSLEELRLNFKAFSHTDCRAFFATLQNNSSLKRVVVEDLDIYFYYQGIQVRSGSTHKNVDASFLGLHDVIARCKQLRHICLWLDDQRDISRFELAVSALSSCTHVTELTINAGDVRLEHDVEVLIADYIKNTTALKELRLRWYRHLYYGSKCAFSLIKIIEALKGNSSLRKLSLEKSTFIEDEAILLADMLRSSKNIHDLELRTARESVEALVNYLLPGFSRNYTLISLRFPHDDYLEPDIALTMQYYFVRNVVRRNCDLVTRAAYCSTGNRSRWCTEAFEVVAENPALVEKVRELQSVGEKEASQIVRNTLSALLGLDDFMRITGVVKRRVSCTNSTDHKLQLEDIDGYSWLHVRRLLKIPDVLPHSFST